MTCDKRMMPFIYTPISITTNIFNLVFGVIIFLSIIQDLVIVAFKGALLYYRSQFIAEAVFTCLLCLNVIVQFFMGFEKKTDITIEREDVDDPIFENQKTAKVQDLESKKKKDIKKKKNTQKGVGSYRI